MVRVSKEVELTNETDGGGIASERGFREDPDCDGKEPLDAPGKTDLENEVEERLHKVV
jgi:hypothetical protein